MLGPTVASRSSEGHHGSGALYPITTSSRNELRCRHVINNSHAPDVGIRTSLFDRGSRGGRKSSRIGQTNNLLSKLITINCPKSRTPRALLYATPGVLRNVSVMSRKLRLALVLVCAVQFCAVPLRT